MIAEFFFPQELKEAIGQLRVENDLNENALKVLAIHTPLFFIFWLIGAVFFTWNGGAIGGLVSVALFFLCVVVVAVSIRKTFLRNLLPYIKGNIGEGVVVSHYYVGNRQPVKGIKIRDSKTSEIVTIAPLHLWDKAHGVASPNIGDKVPYYYMKTSGELYAMPDIEEIKKYFCLSLKLANGESL